MANQVSGKASSDSPALKPYRGKPAVRNFRGGNGNVGIMRSPVRAIALPNEGTLVDLQYVFHGGHKFGAVFRRNRPVFF
jgi:hypothetical protein